MAFDFEWDINTHLLEAASFVDNDLVIARCCSGQTLTIAQKKSF